MMIQIEIATKKDESKDEHSVPFKNAEAVGEVAPCVDTTGVIEELPESAGVMVGEAQ